jgi:glycosyltransferase involved in cell wall biosynthesis
MSAQVDEIVPFRRPASGERPARSAPERGALPELSLVVPAYDEEENLRPLHAQVVAALGERVAWELVLVDDGSRDGTREVIRALSCEDERVRGVGLAANCGQTAALAAGIRHARAPLLATLDADLQNDPSDLVKLLEALGDYDAVVGVRRLRRDSWLKRASSRVANSVRNALTGDDIADTGCSLKLFRTQALREVALFEGMHRFLPTLLRFHGFRVLEVSVGHRPRRWGRSKYGLWNRVFKATRDLFAVRWMRSRILRLPIDELVEPARAPAEERRGDVRREREPAQRHR